MIKLINKVLDRFNLQIVKQDKKAEWGKIIYTKGYRQAILSGSIISEKDLPLVFDMEAPKEHYKYFVDCYMKGLTDGQSVIDDIGLILLKSHKPTDYMDIT